jgi:hypothetical protein
MRAVIDTTLFLMGYSPDDRRKFERELLLTYHGGLSSRGVVCYSYDDLIADYRYVVLASIMPTARS